MNVIIVDARHEFLEDARFALFMKKDIKVIGMQTLDGLQNAVVAHKAEKVIISQNILESTGTNIDCGKPFACFSVDKDGEIIAANAGIPSYGIISSASKLLDAIEKGIQPKVPAILRNDGSEKKDVIKEPDESEKAKIEDPAEKSSATKDTDDNQEKADKSPEKKSYKTDASAKEPAPENSGLETIDIDPYEGLEDIDPVPEYNNTSAHPAKNDHPVPATEKTESQAKKDKKVGGMKGKGKNIKDEIDDAIRKDLGETAADTQIVTVYSAKGGVGKTTIAVELATYLSMIQARSKKYDVCIVDFNIDFGDVRTTMGIIEKGCSLTYWANDIRERMEDGEDPEDISYTKEEVRRWMYKTKTGLYALPAPLTNEDSMKIKTVELEVVLRNIKEYGGFDFVVCDTGNNTRDSTMIALINADTILMLVDQNINTAVCDDAFLQTMRAIDMDTRNTKLVVNRIMPSRSTRISVDEVLGHFPFECVGQIDFSTDVIKATNLGEPLTLKYPNHEFTKQMRKTVAYIIGDSEFEQDTGKKGIFGKFFKRKK